MKHIIFEDNENMLISQLMRRYLGECIVFTGGAENIPYYIDMYNNGSVICYIDYVEDNLDTVANYAELVDEYADNDRVTIVKIPCIELFAYLLLNHYDVRRDFCVANNAIMEYIVSNTDYCYDMIYKQKSLEKYIKAVTEVRPRCINTSKSRNDSFYKVSCKCGYDYCTSVDDDISIDDKFNILYSYLPAKFDDNGNIIFESLLDYNEFMRRSSLVAVTNNISRNA